MVERRRTAAIQKIQCFIQQRRSDPRNLADFLKETNEEAYAAGCFCVAILAPPMKLAASSTTRRAASMSEIESI
jgi:hypothetical protein